ncbi:MAG TPA: cellulose binding domain-containing protein, partial [Ktedonobacteraceae bacterium]|nr:cellulose binding domain-containing protein [Ktedonobacteraceae bacterium]
DSASTTAIRNAGVALLRYPGGSASDIYHWQSHSEDNGGFVNPSDNFDAFMGVAQSSSAQAMITVNYGSGTPQEAAGWVRYANKGGSGYSGPVPTYSGASSTGHTYGIKYWEIGNEVYGDGTYGSTWENNTHGLGPSIYANNVVSYSQAMKAVDSSIKIGVVLTTPGNWPDGVTSSSSPQPWNTTVLSTACSSIDFVILHWYPQGPGSESDSALLSDTSQIAGMASTARSEINQFCGSHASAVQIMLTETNSVSFNPGKQTVGLVNALYLADNYMAWLENGIANVDWWNLHNGPSTGNNNSSSLFGSAQYGDYGVLSTGGSPEPAADTPFPPYYGLQMLSHLFKAGDSMVSSSSNQSLVAVHAVKQANGSLAVLLVNKDPSNSYTVSLALNGYSASANATVFTYGQSSSAITSAAGSSSSVTIAPYSLTTVVLQPGSGSTPVATPTRGTTPVPTATPTRGVTPTATATSVSGSSCKVVYSVASQWQGGFGANLAITNTGTATINGWSLKFSFANGQTITQLWNGSFTQSGANVTITNASFNATIAPGATLASPPGFNGTWNGTNTNPTSFTLNGVACSTS